MRIKILITLIVCICWGTSFAAIDPSDNVVGILTKQAKDLNPQVLQLALDARAQAVKLGITNGKSVLTVIDFSLPSSEKRLWTFDLDQKRLLFHELVSHGKNSGDDRTVRFSNEDGSLMSSLGVYLTADPYIGKNGYSLRLKGLEKGFNDNVYARAVVLHGAPYVNEGIIHALGRLGRSWGCPAVRKEIATPLIDTIRNGTIMVAYYPDSDWLKTSRFLMASHSPLVAKAGVLDGAGSGRTSSAAN